MSSPRTEKSGRERIYSRRAVRSYAAALDGGSDGVTIGERRFPRAAGSVFDGKFGCGCGVGGIIW